MTGPTSPHPAAPDDGRTPDLPLAGLVPYLFGVTGRQELAGPVLVRLLGDIGLSVANARSLIARLREDGALASRADGRRALYRLNGDTALAYERVAGRQPVPVWDGTFHGVLFTVPESLRSYRDRLRRALERTGYGQLRGGLMIHPFDRWSRISPLVEEGPPGTAVHPVRLILDPEHARAIARDAWDLELLAASMRREIAHLQRAALTSAATGPEALRHLVGSVRPALYLALIDPRLPTPLVLPEWPGPELGRAINHLYVVYEPVLGPYLEAVTD